MRGREIKIPTPSALLRALPQSASVVGRGQQVPPLRRRWRSGSGRNDKPFVGLRVSLGVPTSRKVREKWGTRQSQKAADRSVRSTRVRAATRVVERQGQAMYDSARR